MSEQQLKDFAEAAERRVAVPDLADLTSRGRDLRRMRMAACGRRARARARGRRWRALLGGPRRPQSSRPAEDPDAAPALRRSSSARAGRADLTLVPGKRVRRPPVEPRRATRARPVQVPGRGWVWRGDGARQAASPAAYGDLPRRALRRGHVMTADRVLRASVREAPGATTRRLTEASP